MGMSLATVLVFKMNDAALKRRIAELARDSSNIIVTPHAKKRMRQRGILPTQLQQVLLKGLMYEGAHQDIYGCWKCTLELTVAGDLIRAAAALGEDKNNNKVIVITVMN